MAASLRAFVDLAKRRSFGIARRLEGQMWAWYKTFQVESFYREKHPLLSEMNSSRVRPTLRKAVNFKTGGPLRLVGG